MPDDLPRAILGRTGLTVTRLGIGGAYCETADGYRAALDCGVNYVDTARAYRDGEDEKVIGSVIQDRRDDLILATKTVQRDAAGARAELETSLRLLRTDHIDIYQIHNLNDPSHRDEVLAPGGAMEAVQKAREQGLVRFIGVTGHEWPHIAQAVDTGLFDTVLCWYNCAMKEPEETVFQAAAAHGTGVVIMNASRNDKLFDDPDAPAPEQFYRYVLSSDAVGLTIIGLRDVPRFQRVASALAERGTLTDQEQRDLEAFGARMRSAGKLD